VLLLVFVRFGPKDPDKYLTYREREFWRFQTSGIWHHVNWYLGTVPTIQRSLLSPHTGSPVSEDFVTSVFRMVQDWPMLKMKVTISPGNTGIHMRIYTVSCSERLGFSSAPLRESRDYSGGSVQYLTCLMCMPLAVRWYFAFRIIQWLKEMKEI
jgi:hypothetical protein